MTRKPACSVHVVRDVLRNLQNAQELWQIHGSVFEGASELLCSGAGIWGMYQVENARGGEGSLHKRVYGAEQMFSHLGYTIFQSKLTSSA
ncbi:hypothetical protein WJX74_009464 [Apatococcus lobatus]|uniref:Uncharacterized protein n=2 Tax=Apatococcus TaxID=904362 RepID=A0AAW1SPG2_9CHLO